LTVGAEPHVTRACDLDCYNVPRDTRAEEKGVAASSRESSQRQRGSW